MDPNRLLSFCTEPIRLKTIRVEEGITNATLKFDIPSLGVEYPVTLVDTQYNSGEMVRISYSDKFVFLKVTNGRKRYKVYEINSANTYSGKGDVSFYEYNSLGLLLIKTNNHTSSKKPFSGKVQIIYYGRTAHSPSVQTIKLSSSNRTDTSKFWFTHCGNFFYIFYGTTKTNIYRKSYGRWYVPE